MAGMRSREVRLKSYFFGDPTADRFHLAEVEVPAAGPGEVTVRNLWMSLDPSMRGRMVDRPSYVPCFRLNEAMEGPAIGIVETSRHQDFAEGDIVLSSRGWREAFTCAAHELLKIEPNGLPLQTALGLAGVNGLTAYAGLMRIARIKPGETVFVSSAAGGVGSAASLIAKRKGCRVIGSAGGADKIAFLRDELQLDGVIDYKSAPKLTKALAAEAPEGIDVYFDNVGGDHLEAAIAVARPHARFAICGMISAYNATSAASLPRNLFLLPSKRIQMLGFLVADHADLLPALHRDLREWYLAGDLVWKETVYDGIDRAVEALLGLFHGANLGKMLVRFP